MKTRKILVRLNNLIKNHLRKFSIYEEELNNTTNSSSLSEEYKKDYNTNVIPIKKNTDHSLYAYISSTYNNLTDNIGYGLILVKDNIELLNDIGCFEANQKEEYIKTIKTFQEVRIALKAIELAIVNGYGTICIVYNSYSLENYLKGNWKSKLILNDIYENILEYYSYKIKISFKQIDINNKNYWLNKTKELSETATK